MTENTPPLPSLGIADYYRKTAQYRGFSHDSAQTMAVARLQELHDHLLEFREDKRSKFQELFSHAQPPRGVYLWGGVGRGKSFLMDAFFHIVPLVRKHRLHFYHFMQEVHHGLNAAKGEADPLVTIARGIAGKSRLICFDEFHVSDIADAMILGRLLDELFKQGVVFCMTSNYPPDSLYPNGLQRANFLPAIKLIKSRMDVVNVDSGVDYRLRTLEKTNSYFSPITEHTHAALDKLFVEVAEGGYLSLQMDIEGRSIEAHRRSHGIVWFDFATLCDGPRSQADYLHLARQYHSIILSGVPRMGADKAEAARRFTWLVDIFYDHKVKLILSADASPEELYVTGINSGEFQRTVSRLREMQSHDYLALAHIA